MTKNIVQKSYFILALLCLLLILANPKSASAALGIESISPTLIVNGQTTTLSVFGIDFQESSIISIETIGSLPTNYLSSTQLSTILPAYIPPGEYSITVNNPDSAAVTLPNALTVVNQVEPTATNTPPPATYGRPLIVVLSYSPDTENIGTNQLFNLHIQLFNAGQHYATNVVANFTTGTLIPQATGGVVAVGEIAPNNRLDFNQPMIISSDFWGDIATGDMTVTYSDQLGQFYSEQFTLAIPVHRSYSPGPTATLTPTLTPTPSPTPSSRPQLVITSYDTSINPLQPGSQFSINLQITNNGNAAARRIIMIAGGGSSSSAGGGTPGSGGISGANGEFTNFAPIGSSNIQTLGDLAAGSALTASQSLIVNVSTNPGAYPMRISFAYVDENNNSYIDEQVITLLVFRIPNIDVNFYRDPGQLFVGQENILPIQVLNLGRNSVVLGNMEVTTTNAQIANNIILVGNLDIGGYFTLDASLLPDQPGNYELTITIQYTDDFNQSQQIIKTLSVEVLDMQNIEPGVDGSVDGGLPIPDVQPETFLQKVWRFFMGLIGLDSGVTSYTLSEIQTITQPETQIIPIPPLKGP